jgi:hypothetical protein
VLRWIKHFHVLNLAAVRHAIPAAACKPSATTDPHQDEVISDQPVELIRIEPKLRN